MIIRWWYALIMMTNSKHTLSHAHTRARASTKTIRAFFFFLIEYRTDHGDRKPPSFTLVTVGMESPWSAGEMVTLSRGHDPDGEDPMPRYGGERTVYRRREIVEKQIISSKRMMRADRARFDLENGKKSRIRVRSRVCRDISAYGCVCVIRPRYLYGDYIFIAGAYNIESTTATYGDFFFFMFTTRTKTSN